MQSGINVSGTKITGTLHYYKENGWSEGTWPADEQTGNFLILELTSPDGGTIQTKLEGGKGKDWVDVTSDGFCIYRITNKSSQKIAVKATTPKGESSVTYDLTGLTCETDNG